MPPPRAGGAAALRPRHRRRPASRARLGHARVCRWPCSSASRWGSSSASRVARGLGLHLPFHVGWRELAVVAFISTIGFTMALFFATVAIGPGAVLSELKMGALLTLAGGLMALAAARLLRRREIRDQA